MGDVMKQDVRKLWKNRWVLVSCCTGVVAGGCGVLVAEFNDGGNT